VVLKNIFKEKSWWFRSVFANGFPLINHPFEIN
jgi:hypothetical protein